MSKVHDRYRKNSATSNQPDLFNVIDPKERTYWWCRNAEPSFAEQLVAFLSEPSRDPTCLLLQTSKEKAEAYASMGDSIRPWDGKAATPIKLAEAMREARASGCEAVFVIDFIKNEWIPIVQYPCSIPLDAD